MRKLTSYHKLTDGIPNVAPNLPHSHTKQMNIIVLYKSLKENFCSPSGTVSRPAEQPKMNNAIDRNICFQFMVPQNQAIVCGACVDCTSKKNVGSAFPELQINRISIPLN
jgi:hypothetical protein